MNQAEYPSNGTFVEKLNVWLGLAAMAPSAHNTQPWKVALHDQELTISIDPEHQLRAGDPTGRETWIGLGCFVQSLKLAAAHWGYQCSITLPKLITPTRTINVVFTEGQAERSSLFEAIPERHTNRGIYQPENLPEEKLNTLKDSETEPETSITLLTDPEVKQKIGKLVARGVYIGLSLPPLRQELASLISYEREKWDTTMLVESMSLKPDQATYNDGRQWFEQGLNVAEESEFSGKKFAQAPVLAIVSSQEDEPSSWVRSGQTLQKLLLLATTLGLRHCISAAPVEIPTLQPQLRALIPTTAGRPQVLVRLGIPENPEFTKTSPRRTLSLS